MSWNRQFGYCARWRWGVIASLLVLFVCWPAHGHAARESQTQRTWQVASEGWARVTVVQGRLSVDLREADMQTVLAEIAKQAGFTLLTGPLERQTVSVQFADVPLEQGVRRLLRLASLNHVMLSAPDAAGRVALKELRVFAAGNTRSPFGVQESRERLARKEAPELQNPFQALVLHVQEQLPAQPQGEAEAASQAISFMESLRRAQEQREETPARGLGQKP